MMWTAWNEKPPCHVLHLDVVLCNTLLLISHEVGDPRHQLQDKRLCCGFTGGGVLDSFQESSLIACRG